MTITIGVDISKQFLDIYNSHSKEFSRHYNSSAGVSTFLKSLSTHEPQEIKIVMESTGCYQTLLERTAWKAKVFASL